MLLTKEERAKFVAYLRQDVESRKLICEQFAKYGLPGIVGNKLKKHQLDLAKAEQLVADMLDGTEDG